MRKSNGQWAAGSKHLVRHGMAKKPIYNIWAGMMNRCYNPNEPAYKNYGGRGILVHPDWHDFANFYRDVGDRPSGMSIDRIDNDKGYASDNVRWADRITQARNRRNVHKLEIDGAVLTLTEIGARHGLKPATVLARVRAGWEYLAAATTPLVPQAERKISGSHAPRAPKTHCRNGHEMTPENTYATPTRPNGRICLTCKHAAWRRWEESRKYGACHGVQWSDEQRDAA